VALHGEELRGQLRRAASHLLAYPFRVWGFGEGIGIRALLKASIVATEPPATEPLYEGFVRGLFSAWLGRGGPKAFEDHVAPGYELLALYEQTGESKLLEAARRLAALHASFPVCHGVRLHRPDQPGWKRQIWVDCMHIDGPFLARFGRITGDAALFDAAADQVLSYTRHLQESSGLFRHGWESDCGVNGELWARGNGWALSGMLDTLAELPPSHNARPEICQRVEALLHALEMHQCPDGLWHTIVVDESTYAETTLAAMLSVALREAAQRNVFDTQPYDRMRSAAEQAVIRNIGEKGELLLTSEATPVSGPRMYATRRFGVFPWGQGPLILLLSHLAKRK
jgi:unsaturated rhamnogalacturonyl hydrolase